jgi:hypothetical protein
MKLLARLFVILIALSVLVGCATRFLSAEEDAAYKEACEKEGCVVVPASLWQQILILIQAMKTI